jgi:hypothetical protein
MQDSVPVNIWLIVHQTWNNHTQQLSSAWCITGVNNSVASTLKKSVSLYHPANIIYKLYEDTMTLHLPEASLCEPGEH